MSPASNPSNDNGRDDVDAIVDAFMERSVPLLRAILREHFAAPKRRAARLKAATPDVDDHAKVDDLTRARARELLERHADPQPSRRPKTR